MVIFSMDGDVFRIQWNWSEEHPHGDLNARIKIYLNIWSLFIAPESAFFTQNTISSLLRYIKRMQMRIII